LGKKRRFVFRKGHKNRESLNPQRNLRRREVQNSRGGGGRKNRKREKRANSLRKGFFKKNKKKDGYKKPGGKRGKRRRTLWVVDLEENKRLKKNGPIAGEYQERLHRDQTGVRRCRKVDVRIQQQWGPNRNYNRSTTRSSQAWKVRRKMVGAFVREKKKGREGGEAPPGNHQKKKKKLGANQGGPGNI